MVTAVINILTVVLPIFPWLMSSLRLLSPKELVRSADISVTSMDMYKVQINNLKLRDSRFLRNIGPYVSNYVA